MIVSPSVDTSNPVTTTPEMMHCNSPMPSISCALPSKSFSLLQSIHTTQSSTNDPSAQSSPLSRFHSSSTPESSLTLTSKAVHCNCTRSKCLKLYCNCFKIGRFCTNQCECINCKNRCDSDDRRRALRKIRNGCSVSDRVLKGRDGRNVGCTCQNSQCSKKYCPCYQSGRHCTNNCKCIYCRNRQRDSHL